MKVGVQLYTVHDFCGTLDGFADTLARIADMGYSTVQVSGTCPYEAEWLAEQIRKNGLHVGITHNPSSAIIGDTDNLIAKHKVFGCEYIGLGIMDNCGIETYENEFKRDYKPAAQKIAAAGMKFMYHNHYHEYTAKYEDGTPLLHRMAEEFTADEMGFTLDTYWVKYGGADVVEEIKYLKGRLPVVHFKDMLVNEAGEIKMAWVGGGNRLDFEKIIPAFEAAGTKYAYIEQDDCNGENPFDCLKKSYDYLKSLGLTEF